MTRITRTWLGSLVVAAAIAAIPATAQNSAAQSSSTVTPSQPTTTSEPSLGNYARALKKDKKQEAAKKFDNDNLPREDKLSVVGPGSEAADSANAASDQQGASANAASDKAKNSPPAVTPGETPEQRQQVYQQWKEKIASEQSEIDLLSRELDVQQREYKMRAAEFYGDAGERMRNEAGWDKEDAKYKDDLADKQKALDEAKQRLSDMQEDARKAGVPTSQRGEDQPPQQ